MNPIFWFVAAIIRWQQRSWLEWNELASHRLIGIRRTSGNRILIEQEIAQTAERWSGFYEVRHYSTAIGLVEAGLGIAALPCMAMSHHQHESLVSIPLVEPVIRRSIGLIRRNDVPLSPIAERLVNLFLEMWFERKPENGRRL